MSIRPIFYWAFVAVAACAIIAGFVSLQAGILCLIFTLLGYWSWSNPEAAVRLLIIVMPLLPMFKATQTVGDITLIKDVLIICLFVRLFCIPLLKKTLPYRRNVIFAPVAALVVWTCFAWLQADSKALGLLRARDILLYILLYMAVLYLPQSKQLMKQRLRWLLASAAVVWLLAWYQWLFATDSSVLRFDPVRSIWIPRVSATFGHPTVLGEYLIMLITLGTAGLMYARGKVRWWIAAGIASVLPLIYLTYSRGVWLGLTAAWVAMAAAYVISKAGQGFRQALVRVLQYGSAAALLLALVVAFTPAGSFLRASLSSQYSSNAIRLEFATRLVASMSNTEAIIGKGLGDVTQQTFRSTDISGNDIVSGASRDVQLSKDSTLVDNQYLKTFVEMGLIGLVIYGWLFFRIVRNAKDSSLMNMWVVGFLAAFAVQALFVDIWDVFPTNAMFWIVVALFSVYQAPLP
jgi:hypothetical protein